MLPTSEITPGNLNAAREIGFAARNGDCQVPFRVTLLTNQMAPFRRMLYLLLTKNFKQFRIYTSTRSEPNRKWTSNYPGLDIRVQRSISFSHKWKHPVGFEEEVYVHVPLDTLPELRRFRPDVIVSCELGMRSLQTAFYRWMNPQCRLILWAPLSEHMERGRSGLRRQFRRILLRLADAVLVNGRSNARYIEGLGCPKEKIFEVPHAVEMDDLLSVDLSRKTGGARRLLFVGRIVELKGLRQFFEVLGEWGLSHPDEGVEVSIAGEGPESQSLKTLSFPSNIKVLWMGEVSYVDLPQIYGSADVLIFPTLSDEWGLVVNEALAAGVPVLGSEYSQAVDELIRDGVNGWRFVPDDPRSMRDGIRRVMSASEAELRLMRERARESILWLTPNFMERQILTAVSAVAPARAVEPEPQDSSRQVIRSENAEEDLRP